MTTATTGAALVDEITTYGLDAAAHDASDRDLTLLRNYLNADLFAFAQLIFGYKDLIPSLHGDLAAWITDWGWCTLTDGTRRYFTEISSSDSVVLDNRRIMTQIPREFFKSSLGTLANATWQICREPHLPVAIFNEQSAKSEKWLKAIRNVVEGSKLFQQIYRDLLPPGKHFKDTRSTPRSWKWSDSELDLNGKDIGEVEPSISAHGVESATTGGHWPKMILDDLISLKHKMSISEMERAREWIKNHVYLMRPAERSMAYINCTPWTYTDVYRDCLTDYGYRLYRRSALEHNGAPDVALGESIFPQKLSTEKLRSMHKRDPYSFNAQMMCIPQPGREQSFDPQFVRTGSIVTTDAAEHAFHIADSHYSPTIGIVESDLHPSQTTPLYLMDKALILDPSPTEESDKRRDPHARNAFLAVATDCYDRTYLLQSLAARTSYTDTIDNAFMLARRWGIDRLYIEEVNFSNVYRAWIAREQEPGGRYFGREPRLRCFPLTPKGREKHARIMATEPRWRQGLMYVNTADCGQFLVELSEYPNSETIDLLDCMGYIRECVQRPLNSLELNQLRRIQRRGAPYSDSYYKGQESY
jgi:hypothetical protein